MNLTQNIRHLESQLKATEKVIEQHEEKARKIRNELIEISSIARHAIKNSVRGLNGISPEGRKRIADAQKRRWEAYRSERKVSRNGH